MSAVSSELPLAASDPSAPSAHPSSQTQPDESAEPGVAPASADFGPNEWLVDELFEMLPLMSHDTPELGISGGEPALLGERLVELIAAADLTIRVLSRMLTESPAGREA